MTNFGDFYTIQEFADVRQRDGKPLSVSRINKLIHEGRLPAIFRYGRWWIPRAQADRFDTLPSGRPSTRKKGGDK